MAETCKTWFPRQADPTSCLQSNSSMPDLDEQCSLGADAFPACMQYAMC
jgi:hypothetical protein